MLGQFNSYEHEGRYTKYWEYDLVKYAKYDWANGIGYKAKVLKNGKWGILDKNGELILPVEYDMILPTVSNEIFIVQQNGKWGIVKEGKLICPLIYEYITHHSTEDKIRFAVKDGLWGGIDIQGKVVIPFKYKLLQGDAYGTILGFDGNKWFYFLADAEELKISDVKRVELLNKYFYKITYNDDENAIIDHQQNIIIPKSKKRYFRFSGFEDKKWLSVVDENKKHGIWDVTKKTWILEPKYNVIGSRFNNQAFFTKTIVTETINGETKRRAIDELLDLNKKPIISGIVEEYGETLLDNLIKVKQQGKWWLYNNKGVKFLPYSFDSKDDVRLKHKDDKTGTQYLSVKTPNGWGIIDQNKKEIIPSNYYLFGGGDPYSFYKGVSDNSFYQGYKIINGEHKYGILNSQGKEVLPFENEKAWESTPFYYTLNNNHDLLKIGNIETKETYFEITGQPFLGSAHIRSYDINEKRIQYVYNITNAQGLRSIYHLEKKKFFSSSTFHYEQILNGYETFIVEDKNGKKGLADANGKLLTGFEYDFLEQPAFQLQSDLVFAYKNNKVGFIDGKGKVVIPIIHEPVKNALGGIIPNEADYGFSNDLKLNGKIIHYDEKGNKMSPSKYNLPEDVKFASIHVGRQNTVIAYTDKFMIIDPFNKRIAYDYNLDLDGTLTDKQPKKDFEYLYFDGGIEPFVKNGKYGYFDVWGNVVVEPIYDKASPMTILGYCYVMKDNEYFLIDNKGNRLSFTDVPLHMYKVKNKIK